MKKIDLQNMPPQEKKAAEIEVNVLKKLKHQNIVKYVESGFEESQRSGNSRFRTSHLLIVMEFANGGDLSALVAKQKKMIPRKYFKEKRIMRIIIQCMIALGYMHSKHIMHRDIKSANVFLHNNAFSFNGSTNPGRLFNIGQSEHILVYLKSSRRRRDFFNT